MTIQHIVLLRFKPETTEQDREKILKAIAGLKDEVPEIESVQLGVNKNALSKGFTHGLTMTFKSEEDLDIYDKSQPHVDLLNNLLRPRLEDLLIFDYEVESFSYPRPSSSS
ncbi:MAG: stress responsive A/B barrel domain-containing protein [Linnemannia gamsii]|nr:MAG: stress responsive A/B barrel domain-containing protein [Linnemannia gamsii]